MRYFLIKGGKYQWEVNMSMDLLVQHVQKFISRAANGFCTSFASTTLDLNATSILVTSLTACCAGRLVVNFESSDQLLCFGAHRKDSTDSKTASNSFDRLRMDD
ncbi:hypothetical protein MKX03_009212 [Papaver bracteatum]|nr:hypothetical protein MKX03_009212 [Papaver bracteatum]